MPVIKNRSIVKFLVIIISFLRCHRASVSLRMTDILLVLKILALLERSLAAAFVIVDQMKRRSWLHDRKSYHYKAV